MVCETFTSFIVVLLGKTIATVYIEKNKTRTKEVVITIVSYCCLYKVYLFCQCNIIFLGGASVQVLKYMHLI